MAKCEICGKGITSGMRVSHSHIRTKRTWKPKEKQCTEIKVIESNKIRETQDQTSTGVYFFALLIEALTRLIKLIGYVAVFILTSIGITILLNAELRDMVFQILGLE